MWVSCHATCGLIPRGNMSHVIHCLALVPLSSTRTPVRVVREEQKRRHQNVEEDSGEEEHLKTPQLQQILDVIFRPAEDSVR